MGWWGIDGELLGGDEPLDAYGSATNEATAHLTGVSLGTDGGSGE